MTIFFYLHNLTNTHIIMKQVLATLVGFFIAAFVVYLFETLLGQTFFPLPEGSDPTNLEWLKENMHVIPTGAKVFVVIAHFFGIICGMFVAGWISKTSMVPAYIVGILMLAATTFNLVVLPKETWFLLSDAILAIAGFFIGKKLAARKMQSP